MKREQKSVLKSRQIDGGSKGGEGGKVLIYGLILSFR